VVLRSAPCTPISSKSTYVKLTGNARALSEVPRREKTKGAPQRNAGALSIRALEGSRWHQGCVGPQVMGFECW